MIIEQATGNPFYTELRNRFFDPLELTSFNFPSYEPDLGPVAHIWMDLDGDGNLEDAHSFYSEIYVAELNSWCGRWILQYTNRLRKMDSRLFTG
jgi:CubicO group peptidase (beta-lactamase class C family)